MWTDDGSINYAAAAVQRPRNCQWGACLLLLLLRRAKQRTKKANGGFVVRHRKIRPQQGGVARVGRRRKTANGLWREDGSGI